MAIAYFGKGGNTFYIMNLKQSGAELTWVQPSANTVGISRVGII